MTTPADPNFIGFRKGVLSGSAAKFGTECPVLFNLGYSSNFLFRKMLMEREFTAALSWHTDCFDASCGVKSTTKEHHWWFGGHMNGVYATFKDVLTGSKDNTVPPAGIEDTHASGVNEQVSALEQMFAQNIAILKVTIRQREETGKKEAQDAERGFASLRENITMLETKLEETVNSARIKESASQKLEKDLTARNRDLQEELKTNQETLQSRDAEIIDLKSRLLLLSRSIMDMSSFFKQAEGLVSLDQAGGKEVAKEPTNGTEGKPAGAELKRSGAVKSKAADTRPQKVPQEFFDHVTQELTQIIGPMAPMIIHDNVAALGESMEKFPNSRVRELLDSLNKEISEENGKARFRTSFAKQMREGGA